MKTKESCVRECANVAMINRSINSLQEMNNELENVSSLFNIMGNTTRLKIVYLINKEEKICVCDLSDIMNLSVSAISQQLKKIKDLNLLKRDKIGQTIYYFINPKLKKFVDTILIHFNEDYITKVTL